MNALKNEVADASVKKSDSASEYSFTSEGAS